MKDVLTVESFAFLNRFWRHIPWQSLKNGFVVKFLAKPPHGIVLQYAALPSKIFCSGLAYAFCWIVFGKGDESFIKAEVWSYLLYHPKHCSTHPPRLARAICGKV